MKRCLLFSLSLASCQAPEKAADVGRDAVAAEIKTEADKYLKFLFARDLEQWTALFKRDGFEMIINGNARESYEEVATAFGKNFEVWAGVEGNLGRNASPSAVRRFRCVPWVLSRRHKTCVGGNTSLPKGIQNTRI